MPHTKIEPLHTSTSHWQQRLDLAAAFRWTERLGMNEAVAIKVTKCKIVMIQ